MAYTYEDVIPSLIPNTTMQKRLLNGEHRTYVISPIANYVIHDNVADYTDDDNITYRYSIGSCSVGKNYDFDNTTTLQVPDANGNLVTVTAYGSREFFTLPASSVPENNIYGIGNNDQEIA